MTGSEVLKQGVQSPEFARNNKYVTVHENVDE